MKAGTSLAHRSARTERLDEDDVPPELVAACLSDLAAVNTVTLARLPTLGFMHRAVRRASGKPLRVLDLGCGEGDMLRRLHRWSRRTGHRLDLTGLDASPSGIAAARAATPPEFPIEYRVADALDPAVADCDVVISSLFTHHLTDAMVVDVVRMMESKARIGWFINDLHRHVLAYHGFGLLSRLAGWHDIVRHDGMISVTRSFRRADWHDLLRRAGVGGQASVRWHVPFRYCVTRFK